MCFLLEPDRGIQEDLAHLYFLQLISGVVRGVPTWVRFHSYFAIKAKEVATDTHHTFPSLITAIHAQ